MSFFGGIFVAALFFVPGLFTLLNDGLHSFLSGFGL